VALTFSQGANSHQALLLGYANSIRTSDGGTHLEGLKSALTKTINQQARKSKLLKDADANLGGDHVREGLSAVIAVWVPNPEFEVRPCRYCSRRHPTHMELSFLESIGIL